MNLHNDKTILVDADGVLLNWFHAFDQWMQKLDYKKIDKKTYSVTTAYGITVERKRELVRFFNESVWVEHIPPFRDAIKYVKKLHQEHGYVFHCISSLSLEPYSGEARTRCLKNLFGPTAFERFVYLDVGADKDDALAFYKGSELFFVEDKWENADVGISLGLKSLLMSHTYNEEYKGQATKVKNWKEIYDLVIKTELAEADAI